MRRQKTVALVTAGTAAAAIVAAVPATASTHHRRSQDALATNPATDCVHLQDAAPPVDDGDGTVTHTYALPQGGTTTQTVPDQTWSANTASDEEIAALGIPPRPASGQARGQWEATYAHPIGAGYCQRLGVRHATSGNWAGYVNYVNSDYNRVDGAFTVPTVSYTNCNNAQSLSEWTGFGGYYNVPGSSSTRLLQTGEDISEPQGFQGAWWEAIVQTNGVPVHNAGDYFDPNNPHPFAVAGHTLDAYTNYDTAKGRVAFSVTDNTTGDFATTGWMSTITDQNGHVYATSAWYDGQTAEFIGERNTDNGVIDELTNYSGLFWSKSYTARYGQSGLVWTNFPYFGVQMIDAWTYPYGPLTSAPYTGFGGWTADWTDCGHLH